MSEYLMGMDLGGTKSAAIVALSDGTIVARKSAATPVSEGPEAVVDLLIRLGESVLHHSPGAIAGIGISAGAPADADRGVIFDAPNLPGWGQEGYPLAERISNAFGGLPVALENDADATALAEHRFGAGRGAANMVFMTVGTGVGGGLILGGKLHRGAAGAGGEVGHISVVAGGRACRCGLNGCLEAYASGPSITEIAVENRYSGVPGGPEVVAAARRGDAAALAALQQAGEMLGRGIATLAMLLNPERIVLGTLAVHAGDLLLPAVELSVRKHSWRRLHENLVIVPAALGDRAQDLATICAYLHRFSNDLL